MKTTSVDVIRHSSFFNENYYKNTYVIGDDIDPAEHYLNIGWILCYDPSEGFSTAGYLFNNPDVITAGINPLLHYENAGKNERRKVLTSVEFLAATTFFDPYYFMDSLPDSVSDLSENDAISFYLNDGWKSNPSVNNKIDLTKYVDALPEIEKQCVPVMHYIAFSMTKNNQTLEKRSLDEENIIANSKYFDAKYYSGKYNISTNLNLARHYLEYGAKKFFDPSAIFSTLGYFYKNIDVYQKAINPLVHYEKCGKDEKREWLSTKGVVSLSGLFDVDFYCAKYLFESIEEIQYEQWAINDFILNGTKFGRIPFKGFETEENKDVFSSFIDLILNSENKKTSCRIPLEQQMKIVEKSSLFDKQWYFKRYNLAPGTDVVSHYCLIGYKLKCDPSEKFCTEEYEDMYGNEIEEDINPLVHYELIGKTKNYKTVSDIQQTIRSSELFDNVWYTNNFMDGDCYRNPIVHYIKEGALRGYPSSKLFNSARYLICGRDVADLGINPLYHYIKHGKGKRDAFTLFENDQNVRLSEKSIQDYRIFKDYSADTDSLVVFLLPTSDSIGGGVMSINSIAKVTDELIPVLNELNGYKVLLATIPSNNTFSEYTKFDCAYNVYRFSMLRNHFISIKRMIIHIPEIFVADTISQMSPEDMAWLHNIKDLKINILNQNNEMMPRPFYVSFLHAFTDKLTITCAHRRYCTPNQRSSYNMPVHMLSTSNLVEYKYKPYSQKENILLYSPDNNGNKSAILFAIREAFPDLKMKMIKNMEYSEYLELISRAKWMITFGEGLDGYAMESIRSGAISFAVFNHTFFNERFENLPNIYNSYQDMLNHIVYDMKRLDEQEEFKKLNDLLIMKDREEKDEIRYKNNIKAYYKGEFTYPMEEVSEQRAVRMEEKPLVSIVMATYNGERFLKKQLESIASLTYDNFELIISDDGSTDDTLAIIDSFTDRINITVYQNDGDHGVTGNFENGLNHVNGEYVALCDQDDIWMPDHIEKLLYQIDDFDIIHGRLLIIDDKDNYHPASIMHQNYEISKVKYTEIEDYLEVPRLLGCASLIRTSAIKACLPFPKEVPYHDWWITVKSILDGNGICYTDELVTKYRQHGDNTALTEYKDGSRIRKHYEFMNYIERVYSDKLSAHQRDLISRIKNWCLIYPVFQNVAAEGMDAYFSKHRIDFSDEVIEQIINVYNNKERI